MVMSYSAEHAADMIMNDDIREIESADSLDEKSCSSSSDDEPYFQSEASSSNDEPSSQSKVESSSSFKIVVPENGNPFFYFKLLEIIQRSNEYARRVISSNCPLRRKSVLNKWKEVTLQEMKKFFGLVFHMEFVGMPSYRSYWSRSHLYKMICFFRYVPRKYSIHNAVSAFWQRVSKAR